MVDLQSSNVDGNVDNYLLNLCSIPLTIIVRLVFHKKKPPMNVQHVYTVSCLHYIIIHGLAYCPIHVVFISCYVI